MSEKSNTKFHHDKWLKRINGIVLDKDNEVRIILNDNECEIAEFVPLNIDKDYEILTIPPHTIRRKDNHRELKPNLRTLDAGEYVIVLNGKLYLVCEIASKQFYDNKE